MECKTIASFLFSLAQRNDTKETSTLTRPSPIWEGSTAPTRRSYIKVSSPHQRGGLLFFRLAHKKIEF